MTLLELGRKSRECGNQFNTWDIPLLKDGRPYEIDFEVVGSNAEGWHINVIEKT